MADSDTGLLPSFRRRRLRGTRRHNIRTAQPTPQSDSDEPYTGPPIHGKRAQALKVDPTFVAMGGYEVTRPYDGRGGRRSGAESGGKRKRGAERSPTGKHRRRSGHCKKKRRSTVDGGATGVEPGIEAAMAERYAAGYAADDEFGYGCEEDAEKILSHSRSFGDLRLDGYEKRGGGRRRWYGRDRGNGGNGQFEQRTRGGAIEGEVGSAFGGRFDGAGDEVTYGAGSGSESLEYGDEETMMMEQ